MSHKVFSPVQEADVTRAITRRFGRDLIEYAKSDVIIIGAGPAGLVCARDLALQNKKVLVIEQMAHLGGGFWSGGYLMNHATLRHPAQKLMSEEYGVLVEHVVETEGLFTVNAPHAVSALIVKAYEAGVVVFNLTQ